VYNKNIDDNKMAEYRKEQVKMKKLSDSEFEIMKVLWNRDTPMTSNEILDGVKDKYSWKLAGLMTYLARMVDKGYVYCDRSTRTNYYSAVVSQDQYKMNESESFLGKLFDNSATNLIAHLYKGKKISQKEISELRDYLDSLEREGK
jgi:predicted transcriptional regulator